MSNAASAPASSSGAGVGAPVLPVAPPAPSIPPILFRLTSTKSVGNGEWIGMELSPSLRAFAIFEFVELVDAFVVLVSPAASGGCITAGFVPQGDANANSASVVWSFADSKRFYLAGSALNVEVPYPKGVFGEFAKGHNPGNPPPQFAALVTGIPPVDAAYKVDVKVVWYVRAYGTAPV